MNVSPAMRLLLIDQDILGENFLKQILNPNGYEVKKVNSSAEGIQVSQTWQPDIVIINLMQPAVNGWMLCRRLREHIEVPILVLAAVSDPNSIAHWLDAGADDYLTKPLSSEVLIAHLQKLTRRSNLPPTKPLQPIAQ
jgi:DNA-binding response OmpR family regulator